MKSSIEIGDEMRITTHELGTIHIDARWSALYFATIGLVAGFLASVIKLTANVIGASILGFDPFRLLRVYGTIKDGPAALISTNGMSLLDALLMHLVVGSAMGALFMVIMSRRQQFPQFHALPCGRCHLWIGDLDH